MPRTVTLEDRNDDRGLHQRSVTVDDDGTLRIEGHDLGAGVEGFWGQGLTEYEFIRTVNPSQTERLRAVLGIPVGEDLLAAVQQRFGRPGGARELERLLEDNDIASEFWSRVGD